MRYLEQPLNSEIYKPGPVLSPQSTQMTQKRIKTDIFLFQDIFRQISQGPFRLQLLKLHQNNYFSFKTVYVDMVPTARSKTPNASEFQVRAQGQDTRGHCPPSLPELGRSAPRPALRRAQSARNPRRQEIPAVPGKGEVPAIP